MVIWIQGYHVNAPFGRTNEMYDIAGASLLVMTIRRYYKRPSFSISLRVTRKVVRRPHGFQSELIPKIFRSFYDRTV
jgi:hypothetical protein